MCGLRPLLLILLAALSGCGDIPRPFDHTGDAYGQGWSRQLTRLATADAVTVEPPPDLPDAQAAALATAVVQALHAQETPARVGRSGHGYRLSAVLQGDALRWSLTEPGGAVISTVVQSPSVPVGAVAATVVPALDADRERPLEQRMKVGAAPAPAQDPAQARPVRVMVEAPAPQQAEVLRNAMESALRQSRFSLTRDNAVTAVEIRGTLALGTPQTPAGTDVLVPVAVVWVVVDAAGKEAGTARQGNPVPKRLIDGSFPMLAVAIAQAGAGGIADILDRVSGVARKAGSD